MARQQITNTRDVGCTVKSLTGTTCSQIWSNDLLTCFFYMYYVNTDKVRRLLSLFSIPLPGIIPILNICIFFSINIMEMQISIYQTTY